MKDQIAQKYDALPMGQYFLRFEDEEDIEQYYKDKARDELREDGNRPSEALAELKRMITEEGLYIPLDENDIYLYAFLRGCKYYPESAFKKLKYLYKCRIKYPKYFHNVIPSRERNVFENNLITVPPQRDQHGRRMIIVHSGQRWNPSQCSLAEITRGVVLAIEAALHEPRTQIAGSVMILDLEGMSIQHVWQFSPSYAKMALDWLQEAMPLRIKTVHVINQSYIFNMVFAIFKPFIREKLRNRIYLHGADYSSVMNHIEPKFWPTQFGGLMDIPLDQGLNMWKFFCQFEEKYLQTAQFGYRKKA